MDNREQPGRERKNSAVRYGWEFVSLTSRVLYVFAVLVEHHTWIAEMLHQLGS